VPALSIVIPVLGRHDVLARVLDGLAAQHEPPTFELVLVADAGEPDAGAVQRLAGAHGARFLRAERPGASAARNAGWRAARHPVVLFLGADILPCRQLLAEHAAWHEREPSDEVGVLGHVAWADDVRVTPFMRWLERGIQFDYGALAGEDASWAHLYTANVSLKRAFVARVGGFDEERFPFLYEDLDLGRRLAAHGLRLRYARAARGGHHHPATPEDWERRVAAIARAERTWIATYPDQPAYFHDLFAEAMTWQRARGRGVALAPFVPPGAPWLGAKVWRSVDVSCRQRLAPAFLAAWEEARPARRSPAPAPAPPPPR
jgi:GT2 family glycosyltransferase